MKAVILAAGKGKRFRALNLPKPLTYLENGQTILGLQLQALSSILSIDDILIVVGYRKEVIIERFPDLLYVFNPLFEEQNTAKSLLRALRKIHNEDVLWLNGDVVFKPSILSKIVVQPRNSLIVNTSPVGDEEVKYRARQEKIIEISKTVSHPDGEALGINLIVKESLESFKLYLEECSAQDYFEKAIELGISAGLNFWAVPVGNEDCTEVDFPEDLIKANKVIGA